MNPPVESVLLRIFISEDAQFHHRPLYEAIVLKAREMHMAGATVLRGPLGFGHSEHLHNAKILRLSVDLPIVVEIVDTNDKVQSFLLLLEEMVGDALVTLEKVQVVQFGGAKSEAVGARADKATTSAPMRWLVGFAAPTVAAVARAAGWLHRP